MLDEKKIEYYLSHFKTLQFEDLISLFQLARTRELEPGAKYIREGDTSPMLAYITKGLVRVYARKDNGDEVTLQLYWEDQFFGSRHSIFGNQPSPYWCEAVEPTTLLEANYAELMKRVDSNPRYAEAKNFFYNNLLSDAMDKTADFILLSPQERYLKLVREKADIVNRVPDKYIATILGITQVSLSRIRKRIASGH